MLLGASQVVLEEAGAVYSSMIHVCIRLKSDSLAFPIDPLKERIGLLCDRATNVPPLRC
jgi:hypothetical protein